MANATTTAVPRSRIDCVAPVKVRDANLLTGRGEQIAASGEVVYEIDSA